MAKGQCLGASSPSSRNGPVLINSDSEPRTNCHPQIAAVAHACHLPRRPGGARPRFSKTPARARLFVINRAIDAACARKTTVHRDAADSRFMLYLIASVIPVALHQRVAEIMRQHWPWPSEACDCSLNRIRSQYCRDITRNPPTCRHYERVDNASNEMSPHQLVANAGASSMLCRYNF